MLVLWGMRFGATERKVNNFKRPSGFLNSVNFSHFMLTFRIFCQNLEHPARQKSVPGSGRAPRKVDVRLPEKENSRSHGARPVHLTITVMKWIRTSRL
jgi:hypothetical protein